MAMRPRILANPSLRGHHSSESVERFPKTLNMYQNDGPVARNKCRHSALAAQIFTTVKRIALVLVFAFACAQGGLVAWTETVFTIPCSKITDINS